MKYSGSNLLDSRRNWTRRPRRSLRARGCSWRWKWSGCLLRPVLLLVSLLHALPPHNLRRTQLLLPQLASLAPFSLPPPNRSNLKLHISWKTKEPHETKQIQTTQLRSPPHQNSPRQKKMISREESDSVTSIDKSSSCRNKFRVRLDFDGLGFVSGEKRDPLRCWAKVSRCFELIVSWKLKLFFHSVDGSLYLLLREAVPWVCTWWWECIKASVFVGERRVWKRREPKFPCSPLPLCSPCVLKATFLQRFPFGERGREGGRIQREMWRNET